MKNNNPLISVLMPVYNAEAYVEAAIRSILVQTMDDFEFLIFDDGSTDGSIEVINSIKDKRIILFNSAQNFGYVTHLNRGLSVSRGKYIARMDSDDVALPDRLSRQVAFLDSHPEVGVCGTAFRTFGSRSIVANTPVEDSAIREFMLQYNPIGHPTVMMRKSLIEEYNLKYVQEAMPAEDYLMWYEFSKISALSNLPEILLEYRTHDNQISYSMNSRQRSSVNEVRWLQLRDKGIILNKEQIFLYCQLLDNELKIRSANELSSVLELINSILIQNKLLNGMPSEWLERMFEDKWTRAILSIKKLNPRYLHPLFIRKNMIHSVLDTKGKIWLLIKSLLFWNRED